MPHDLQDLWRLCACRPEYDTVPQGPAERSNHHTLRHHGTQLVKVGGLTSPVRSTDCLRCPSSTENTQTVDHTHRESSDTSFDFCGGIPSGRRPGTEQRRSLTQLVGRAQVLELPASGCTQP